MIKAFDNLAAKLKELDLTEEQVQGIVDFEKKNIPKDFIPSTSHKETLQEKEARINELSAKLDETNKSLEQLKDNDNQDELKNKLDTIKQEYEEFKNQVDQRETTRKKESIFKKHMVDKGFNEKAVDLLTKQVEFDSMQLKDNSIIGLDEHIQPLEEEYSFLKVNTSVNSQEPKSGDNDKQVDTSQMSDAEFYKYRQQQKEK